MVNRELIKINIEKYSPLSEEYIHYWKDLKRKCIEGLWIGNDYIPASIFFYRNFWNIKLNKDNSKSKSIGNPHVRDIEWERAWLFMEARGFSGFIDDDEYHCDYKVLANQVENPDFVDKRKFLNPEDYLKRSFPKPLGKPLYRNESKNVLDLECRDSGKSYWVASLAGSNFIFDGALDYDEYLEALRINKPMSSETMIGAIDAFYSGQTCNKLILGLDNLEGSMLFQDKFYPSPLWKYYDGSLQPSKFIIAKKDVKIKNNWVTKGSKSILHHRTFYDNELAGNGTRPSFTVLDEVGFMDNLTSALSHLKDCTSDGGFKFGTIYMTGTGGDSKGKGTEEIKKVFNNPEEYDCVTREDIYENRGRRAFFIPKYLAYGADFRDSNGVTLKDKASKKWEEDYEKAKNSADSKKLDEFLQNSPATPSHALLSLTGNRYPTAQLSDHLTNLETLRSNKLLTGIMGDLIYEKDGTELKFKVNSDLRNCDYPIIKGNKKGGITIYEHPVNPVKGKYIAGCDPTASDGDANQIQSDSVLSCIIYKRSTVEDPSGDIIVAEYTGREDDLRSTNENVRKLLLYYNALCLYENNFPNLKEYLENKNHLFLLAKTPKLLTNSASSKAGITYGVRINKTLHAELETYVRDWLLDTSSNGKPNFQNIYSIGLIKELLAAGEGVNTDREVALKLVILLKLQFEKVQIEENKKDQKFNFKDWTMFTNA